MVIKRSWLKAIISLILITGCTSCHHNLKVTTGSLLDEMLDLKRLTYLPEVNYHTIQFSSYDRSSISPSQPGWFSNSDGFGGEPTPGFEKILKVPDSAGNGEYLICDIHQPGAILRLWTAGINGKIRLFLDGGIKPVFEGTAQEFFWNTASLSDSGRHPVKTRVFRQYDAVYFPIPFSKSCRIEWIGNPGLIHFYHVTVRVYESIQQVTAFSREDLINNRDKVEKINRMFSEEAREDLLKPANMTVINSEVSPGSKKQLFTSEGTGVIDLLALKLNGGDPEEILRKCILSIYFDSASVPQVQAPMGDFFGAAPGIVPYSSFPFTVRQDSVMVCRFMMPYKREVRIEMENFTDKDIRVSGGVNLAEYEWKEGRSMYFQARWRISHGLTASDSDISDIPYFLASGKGRIVGSAAYIYNPSNAVTSWGNWWGEGDEKIWIDKDQFPSLFGTGSEDYFNYSWSSETLFAFPYCGQPRNDGPGNRGYVSNYRWHILDDIPFYDHSAFYMELLHHGVVHDFSYGRIVYFYALPDLTDDYQQISMQDISVIPYLKWEPIAYLGSAGYTFIHAEQAFKKSADLSVEKGKIWAGGNILMWKPVKEKQRILFNFRRTSDSIRSNIGLTLAHLPGGGEISFYLNGKPVKFDGAETIRLEIKNNPILRNHFSETIRFVKGINELAIENRSSGNSKVGLDFIWIKQE
jgi:hypothetical protein